jgi:ABC-type transporter Mla maintaining outer membrane lipid asymmetry permease subunit MlaE
MLGYLLGTLFGELGLLAWWGMSQETRVTPGDYFRSKWAAALFSLVVALTGCMLWAEGSIVKHLGDSIALTTGYSVASGAVLTFFAHGIVALVGNRFGLNPPTKGD